MTATRPAPVMRQIQIELPWLREKRAAALSADRLRATAGCGCCVILRREPHLRRVSKDAQPDIAVVLRGSQVLTPQDDGDPLLSSVVMGPGLPRDDDLSVMR